METRIAKYLADEMGKAERAQFEAELLSDEQLSNELQKCAASWEVSSVYTNDSFDSDAAWNKIAPELTIERQLKPEKNNFSFLKIAASIVIVAAAGFFLAKNGGFTIGSDNEPLLVETANQVEEVTLPDGSVVRLNANSSISYDESFGESNRNVTLMGGANFDVQRNENLPFVISTVNSEVEVLGTSFEVRAYENESVEVNVTSGKVGFKSTKAKGEPAVLEAGEKAVLSADGTQMQKGKLKNNNFSAWWTKQLEFENVSLADIAKDLQKTYWVEIEVAESIAKCEATLYVNDQTIDGALDILQATFPAITITKDKENHIKLDGIACND
ncbi:hypothetical protein AWW68_02200 [Roseivirga spongicola]|uniref:FecR protein domain-containing protein n=1 Tax=Roseivirga spongicola TaxID=333140 RepID=A0A150XFW5_9BACT|nr:MULTISPECIES: FecR domain-containing protein [Roseivirga]KYG77605.1 hypothetical protein AWW68_02200 [Roseivirga spongicola]MBO6661595.1 FecR domain-containing protein [Roseivirga sp.]MBO6908421.1 FecR domain-containing protein [Roseivirga sp.]